MQVCVNEGTPDHQHGCLAEALGHTHSYKDSDSMIESRIQSVTVSQLLPLIGVRRGPHKPGMSPGSGGGVHVEERMTRASKGLNVL
jgi:hypothetical protein